MKTVTIKYDEITGNVYDTTGAMVCTMPIGLFFPDEVSINSKSPVEEMAKLKGSGFTADEIMQMKREGLF